VTRARLVNLLAPFCGLALVLALFSWQPAVRERFLTGENFRIVANQTVIVGLGALGMTLIIVSGGIDLSVGSTIAFTSVVVAKLIAAHHPPMLAALAAIGAGGLIGAMNSVLITRLRLTPFIITLGTLGIVRGATKWLANMAPVNCDETWLNQLTTTQPTPAWLIVSPGVWVTIMLAALLAVVLRCTAFGRSVFAVGSNEAGARLSGLRVDALKVGIYSLAGLFFGLAGVCQFTRLSQGDPTTAAGEELNVIAAVVIGGGSLSGGQGSVLGSLIGALIMAFLRNGAQQMDLQEYVEQIIIGAVIVAAVALDRWRQR